MRKHAMNNNTPVTFKVRNFNYNGFYGELKKGFTKYTATFSEWTVDPGVGIFLCSDNTKRSIPTFAIEGDKSSLPTQEKTGCLFGVPCTSEGME
jgi:hypothetical protein